MTSSLIRVSISLLFTALHTSITILFFFNDTATTEIYTLSLHDALPICELFSFWMQKPASLPPSYQQKAEQESLPRVVCDYIAGMTDNFIIEQYEKHGLGREPSAQRITG